MEEKKGIEQIEEKELRNEVDTRRETETQYEVDTRKEMPNNHPKEQTKQVNGWKIAFQPIRRGGKRRMEI